MILTKKNIYLITIISCLLLVAFGILVVIPYVQDIFALSNDIKDNKASIRDYDLRELNFKKLKQDEEEANEILDELSDSLVSKDNSLEFIVLLEEIARKTFNEQSIELIDESEEEEKRKTKSSTNETLNDPLEAIEALYFNVRLQGNHKNLLRYLVELENLGVYADVVSMEIKSSSTTLSSSNEPFENSDSNDQLRTTLLIRAFVQ